MKKICTKYFLSFFPIIFYSGTNCFAQVIYNNAAVITISNNTVINSDSIIISSGATLNNNGTTNLISINNAGTIQGNGTYNISNLFSNYGTFNCGTSTVHYNGNFEQTIAALNYYNLTISNSRTNNNITFSNLGTIGIAGSFNPNATFTSGSNIIAGTSFDFNGSGAQNIPSFTFEHVNFSGGNTKTLTGHLTLKNSLAIGANTTLDLSNYNITLQSNATSTARVATNALTAAITYGSGRFISERYIPGRRKYRLLSSPVTTSELTTLSAGQESLSIWGNWQNSGNNSTPNIGTIITGGSVNDGFDQHTSTPSVFNYDDIGHRYVSHSTLHGKNTKYTPLKAGVAYYFFVYGDRLNSVSTSTPNFTTLKASGKILIGDQTYTINSSQPLTNIVGDYTFLGNPFASPIDWATLPKTNLENTYWGWDPNLSNTGGYVTVNSSGGVTLIAPFSGTVGLNQYIQSGQGFFVRTAAANPTLTIREIDKVSDYNVNAFRGPKDLALIAVNLFYKNNGNSILADGTLAAFDSSFNNNVDKEDASKLFTSVEGIAIKNQTKLLSIDTRRLPTIDDSIAIYTTNLNKDLYTLQIYIQNIDNKNLQPYLEDKYLNSLQILSTLDTNNINFIIDKNNALSKATDRFKIVFKSPSSLPGSVIDIKAEAIRKNILVSWTTFNNQGVEKFEILKSSDGVNFSSIGEKQPNNTLSNFNYELIDENPINGVNYYQIKSISVNGVKQFSKVATVVFNEQKASMILYPNPIKGKQFIIQLTNLNDGIYNLSILSLGGKLIEQQKIQYQEIQRNHQINLSKTLSSGMYLIRIENEITQLTEKIIIEN
ncbi:MAG: T9SS type A sorting domain-containing protein [Chitinophagaceae bacterium]|nr:T9SS type A sorting domain-containing protein [Chitinophagaceae bacterium]